MSLNEWMYVEGNPITRVDPSGQYYTEKENKISCPVGFDCVVENNKPKITYTLGQTGNLSDSICAENSQPNLGHSKPMLKPMYGSKGCGELARSIVELMDLLDVKADAIRDNPLNLPYLGRKMTVKSHQDKYKTYQKDLRDLIREWNKSGCGPPPNGAVAYTLMAVPQPKVNNQSNITFNPPTVAQGVAIGLGALGYFLYNSKGCVFGPVGCIVDWITPFP